MNDFLIGVVWGSIISFLERRKRDLREDLVILLQGIAVAYFFAGSLAAWLATKNVPVGEGATAFLLSYSGAQVLPFLRVNVDAYISEKKRLK